MGKHLTFDEKVKKEYKINDNIELDTPFKYQYVRSQFEEIKKAMYRVRVDLLIAQYQVDHAEDDTLKVQFQNKVAEHRMMLRQFVRSLLLLEELLGELEATVPAE